MNKYYAGIGSRNTPPDILELMTEFAILADELNYTLRSGGADGADKAFAKCTARKEIFKSVDCQPWAIEEVKKHLPTDRSGFDNWNDYVKGLLGRNMMQILGKDGKCPVDFVVCWAPSIVYSDSSSGGTGYAIRCALAYGIPIHNMFIEADKHCIIDILDKKTNLDKLIKHENKLCSQNC